MKENILFIMSLFVCVLLPNDLFSQAGLLDNSFDSDGKLTTPVGTSAMAWSVGVQTDGKILTAGYCYNDTSTDFAIVRYNNNGTLDPGFGIGGIVITDIAGLNDRAHTIAIQTDGKIVVGGTSDSGSDYDFAIARYNYDGSLDSSFGTGGLVVTAFSGLHDYGNSVVIQSDGKIILAGQVSVGVSCDFGMVRYNIDGSIDNTFDVDGLVSTDFGSSYDQGYSLALQSDGKIVFAGFTDIATYSDYAVVRYNTNGSLDNTFDGDGKVVTSISNWNDYAYSVKIQQDGKIVIGGHGNNGTNNDFALVRLNSDGSIDNSFDLDGKVITPIGGGNDEGYSVSIQADGKIVIAGRSFNGPNDDFAILRYNSDGSLDNTFDSDGKLTTEFGTNADFGWSVAIQADNKIVVCGESSGEFAVARYLGDLIGIDENDITANIKLFPNPTTGKILICSDKAFNSAEFEILNSNGQIICIYKNIYGNSETIDVTNLSFGVYYLIIAQAGKKSTFRFIKN